MTGIYCYYNKINGKRYVGQAMDLDRRKKDHLVRAFNEFSGNNEYNSILHRAFRKYGYDNFEYSILEECSVAELNNKEMYWIAFYDCVNNGYNINAGGNEKHFCKLNQEILNNIEKELVETEDTLQTIADRNGVSVGFVSDFNRGNLWKRDNIDYPIRKPKIKEEIVYTCAMCGEKISSNRGTGLCHACYSKGLRKVSRPSREELKDLIRKTSFKELGDFYGVADNSIKKWCKAYGLPHLKKDIKTYSDEEWKAI